jgi:hypothetical protein
MLPQLWGNIPRSNATLNSRKEGSVEVAELKKWVEPDPKRENWFWPTEALKAGGQQVTPK